MKKPGPCLVLTLLLGAPLAVPAADFHVSAGGSVSSDSSGNTPRETQAFQLGGRIESARGWGLGVEGLLRLDDFAEQAEALGVAPSGTRQESLGLELRYSLPFLARHRAGIGVAAGRNRLAFDHAIDSRFNYDEDGSYRAGSLFYDYLPAERLSIGLDARHQVDRMQKAYPDPGSFLNLNATGLNNIVFNPYAFPSRSYKTHLVSVSVNVGYRF